jgi:hypothetical protein
MPATPPAPRRPQPARPPARRRPPQPVAARNRKLEAVAALLVLALVVLLALYS